jgi:hypothetical protein
MNKLKFILKAQTPLTPGVWPYRNPIFKVTDDTTKLSLKTIGDCHLIAQRSQTTWRVSKNKITGEIGTMSLDKIWEIMNETI